MWIMKSSIGRKVIMAVTGIGLILFLTFHASMNMVALFSAQGYNNICQFLGANWYAVAATAVLALLMMFHFVLAVHLVIWNMQARGPQPYTLKVTPENVEWSSQNMFSLGAVILLGLGLHLYHFWSKMMFAELSHSAEADLASNGIYHLVNTFHGIGSHTVSGYVYTLVYLVWLLALWFHLNHGVWSSLQSLGLNNRTWFPRLKMIGTCYSTLIVGMFAAVAIAFCLGYVPCDMN